LITETWVRPGSAADASGRVATDFGGSRGTRTPEHGAAVAIRLATLPVDGPTGLVFEDKIRLAW
jgi:hypothetical protein